AYSLRCMPQVHGAVRDALAHAARVLTVEANSVTDNPLIFPDEPAGPAGGPPLGGPAAEPAAPGRGGGITAPSGPGTGSVGPAEEPAGPAAPEDAAGDVVSGGNFHGEPVALVLDYATMALAELAGIAERRIERLVNPQLSGLPAFLTRQGGLHSGLMLAQYTAAALVGENKTLAMPASVDSIPSSANQEDHVSMGMTAALKLWRVVEHVRWVLAIELLCAAQALDLVGPGGLSPATAAVYQAVRALVPPLAGDRELAPDMAALAGLLARRGLPLPGAGPEAGGPEEVEAQ
ncbi:MAG TPA: aromatic amino acid lyase, partial [Thermaerobacter sp.]